MSELDDEIDLGTKEEMKVLKKRVAAHHAAIDKIEKHGPHYYSDLKKKES